MWGLGSKNLASGITRGRDCGFRLDVEARDV